MRITSVTGKITYVVGVFALILALNVFLIARIVNPTFDVLIVAVLNIAYVVVGVRTFRGAEENRDGPAAVVAGDRTARSGLLDRRPPRRAGLHLRRRRLRERPGGRHRSPRSPA